MPYERPTGWYSDFRAPDVKNPKRRRRYRLYLGDDVRTLKEAKAAERRMQTQVEDEAKAAAAPSPPSATASVSSVVTFSGLADRWWRTVVRIERKPGVQRTYEATIRNWLIPFFGDEDVRGIGVMRIEEFRAWCTERVSCADEKDRHGRLRPMHGRKRSPKTINETLGVLSSMLTKAVAWRILTANPCHAVERLQLPPPEFQFYGEDDMWRWLSACARAEPAWLPFFTAGFRTGMREGELFALEWGDLDFGLHRIMVRRSCSRGAIIGEDGRMTSAYVTTLPKSGKARMLEMSPQLAALLLRHRHLRGPLVFCDETGAHLTRERMKYPWEKATRVAGLPLLRPHDMRHSFASQLVMKGVPLRRVQDLLGHSTIRMTERYAHLAPTTDASVVALLDRLEMDTEMDTGTVAIRPVRRIPGASVVGAEGFEPDSARQGKRRS